jgi:hypothetical protein
MAMKTPRIVTPQEWQDEWQRLLVKEKEMTRARDALAAERRRMPWVSVNKPYTFEGPEGTMNLRVIAGRHGVTTTVPTLPGWDTWCTASAIRSSGLVAATSKWCGRPAVIMAAVATSEARCSGDTAVSHRLIVSPVMPSAECRTVAACNAIGSWTN